MSIQYAQGTISVKARGAVGDWNPLTSSGTDDRAAFVRTFAEAVSSGAHEVVIPPGNYRLSKYVVLSGAVGVKIRGSAFATIYFASDETTTLTDSTAVSYNQARSALLIKNCRDVTIENIGFVGGDTPEISYINLGSGVYVTRSTGTRVVNCRQTGGYSLLVQDANTDSTAVSGNVISVSSGIVTMTNDGDPNYAFHGGMVGRKITVTNATNMSNNGVFVILSVVSATQLKYANLDGVDESSSPAIWSVEDADDDTYVVGCTTDNCRGVSYTAPNSTYEKCVFNRQMTNDLPGIPDAFTDDGATTTITDASARLSQTMVGKYIKIAGATTGGNNGTYKITAIQLSTQDQPGKITYDNGGGTTELADQDDTTYLIFGGEKSGLGKAAGNAITNASGVVTFEAASATFVAGDVGRVIRLINPSNAENRGAFVISRYVSSTIVEYINSQAVTETFNGGVVTIDGYDSIKADAAVGPSIVSTTTGTGVNSLTDGSLSMVTNAYGGKYLVDSAGRHWKIVSNTGTVFTLTGGGTPASGAYEVFAGATHGSTHGIYLFAGRSGVRVTGCTFRGIRTIAVKVSGSNAPIRDIVVDNNKAFECGAFFVGGADDGQEHSNLAVHHNTLVNCSLGRVGWNDQTAIGVYGARNVKITDNQLTATHDAVPALLDGTFGGYYGIFAGRYLAGRSRPLVSVSCDRNTFVIDGRGARSIRVAIAAIHAERVGQRAKWRTADGTNTYSLSVTGSTVTLTDALAFFDQSDVGSSIELFNSNTSGNDGVFTITEVVSTTELKFVNGGSPANDTDDQGTYRIKPKAINIAQRGSTCSLSKNDISGYGAIGVETVACLAPEIVGNNFNAIGTAVLEEASVGPRIAGNREITAGSSNARIRVSSSTSWPFIDDNIVTNGAMTGSSASIDGVQLGTRSDMGVGVDGPTAIDYPLCGKRGRTKSTAARAEVVLGFGGEFVDGDSIVVNGSTYTYKSVSPGAGQFNSLSSFLALVGSGFTAEDYGAGLTGTPTTGHVRIRLSSPARTIDHGYVQNVNTLNPTALVVLFNATGGGDTVSYTRGEGNAKTGSAWTASAATFTADNTTDRLAVTGHGLATGEGIGRLSNSGGALPTGLDNATDYWAINVDADHFQVANSRANALAGTPVTFSDDGTGTHTITMSLAQRFTVWSPACQRTAGVMIMPENLGASRMMTAGIYHEKDAEDAGACEVMAVNSFMDNTDEFRWMIS